VAAFARHKARLEEVFRLPLPTYESVRWAWDKRATYELAERLGIPAPRTRSPVDADELAALDLEFPLVVKPAIKEHFFYATNVKAWRVEDYAELSARFAEAAALVPLGEVMVQELIAGDRLYAYGAFFKDGEALGTMVVRRWRQYPREFGRWSTYVETIDLPLLERQSEEFLRAIDYYGLVELEYKHDARDGRYKLLDVNARAWAYHSIGYAAGVDFPALLFADATGQPVEPLRARTGVTWVRLLADLPIVLSDMAHGRRGPRSLLDTVFRSDAEAVVSLSDPAPALAEVAVMPYRFARSVFRARRSSTATSQPTLSA
jgi:D-aspartate ligase